MGSAAEAPPSGAIAAHRAFESGNFGEARRLSLAMLSASPPPDEPTRAAATAVLDRLRLDPVAVLLLAGCLVLFICVIAWSY